MFWDWSESVKNGQEMWDLHLSSSSGLSGRISTVMSYLSPVFTPNKPTIGSNNSHLIPHWLVGVFSYLAAARRMTRYKLETSRLVMNCTADCRGQATLTSAGFDQSETSIASWLTNHWPAKSNLSWNQKPAYSTALIVSPSLFCRVWLPDDTVAWPVCLIAALIRESYFKLEKCQECPAGVTH